MRITERGIQDQSIALLQKNLERLATLQEQLATQKRINRPSDDPVGMTQVLGFDVVRNNIDQYLRNLDAVETPLNTSDAALAASTALLDDAKKVALDQSSTASEPAAAASNQIQNDFNQLIQTANTTLDGRYLFSGHKTDTPSYDAAGVYQGDAGVTTVLAGPGVTIMRNLPGQNAFGSASTGVDTFGLLTSLKTAINNQDEAGIRALLPQIDQARTQITGARAAIALQQQAVVSNRASLTTLSSTVDQLKSDRQGIDLATVIVEFQAQQTALQAFEQASARTLQHSLLDFLQL